MSDILVKKTDIPGLLIVHTPVQKNPSGWFTENWHQEKMKGAGAPVFTPVQHNITHVEKRGITRGFHAEPWDRYVSILSGRVFGAWIDMRDGDSWGTVVVHELAPGTSVFVPKGVGNAHQVLEAGTTFNYLLAEHWTPEARERVEVANLFDPALKIEWPIAREDAILSERDMHAPYFFSEAEELEQHMSMFPRAATGQPLKYHGSENSASSLRSEPFRILFVCTANICRSAYADVVAQTVGSKGFAFASAGTHALVGQAIDPPMADQVAAPGETGDHRAQQLSHELVEKADLILAMGAEHRRYILDEWPSAARKTFIIGHAAREISSMPEGSTLDDVTTHLWHHRGTSPRDEVDDPYRRGQGAAIKAARSIDTHLEDILPRLKSMADKGNENS